MTSGDGTIDWPHSPWAPVLHFRDVGADKRHDKPPTNIFQRVNVKPEYSMFTSSSVPAIWRRASRKIPVNPLRTMSSACGMGLNRRRFLEHRCRDGRVDLEIYDRPKRVELASNPLAGARMRTPRVVGKK